MQMSKITTKKVYLNYLLIVRINLHITNLLKYLLFSSISYTNITHFSSEIPLLFTIIKPTKDLSGN